jgi:hypothetical protein
MIRRFVKLGFAFGLLTISLKRGLATVAGSLDSSTFTTVPVRVMNPLHFNAWTVGIVSTLSTRNTAAFHPLLNLFNFHGFRDAWVWHPHCLPMSRERCTEEIQRLASRAIEGGTIK